MPIAVGSVLFLLLTVAFLLMVRRALRPLRSGAICGQCSQSLSGGSDLACPSCGSDLRSVGAVVPAARGGALVYLLVLASLGLLKWAASAAAFEGLDGPVNIALALVLCTGTAVFVRGGIIARLAPRATAAACARCDFPVTNPAMTLCTECGTDLLATGLIPPGAAGGRAVRAVQRVVRGLVLWFASAGLVAGALVLLPFPYGVDRPVHMFSAARAEAGLSGLGAAGRSTRVHIDGAVAPSDQAMAWRSPLERLLERLLGGRTDENEPMRVTLVGSGDRAAPTATEIILTRGASGLMVSMPRTDGINGWTEPQPVSPEAWSQVAAVIFPNTTKAAALAAESLAESLPMQVSESMPPALYVADRATALAVGGLWVVLLAGLWAGARLRNA